MKPPIFQEIFNSPISEFEKHLGIEDNERIFFSGRYGSGKTSFIKNYFSQDKIREQYEVYHLFPVNYSISSNEDIIKYIKYDIILAMLERHDNFPEESKGFMKTLPAFMLKRIDKVLEAIIAMVPEVGKSILEMYEKLGNLKDEYLAYHDKINKGDGDKLGEYLDQMETQPGSLVENDVITKIISEKIYSNKPKKSLLIVDDLDRLDPEHVFRILNVFAAHFDVKTSSRSPNKFGFDHVIIVSDIENIRNIFHHRYGVLADFSGYIDKFYSADVYHFDNKSAVAKITGNILSSYVSDRESNQAKHIYFQDGWLEAIVNLLLEKGDISLRTVLNTYGKELSYHKEHVDLMDDQQVEAWRVPTIYKLKYLTELVGGIGKMVKIFEKFKQEQITLKNTMLCHGNLLYILNYHLPGRSSREPFLIKYNDDDIILEVDRRANGNSNLINIVKMYYAGFISAENRYHKSNEYFGETNDFWQLTINVIKRLEVLGYLK